MAKKKDIEIKVSEPGIEVEASVPTEEPTVEIPEGPQPVLMGHDMGGAGVRRGPF